MVFSSGLPCLGGGSSWGCFQWRWMKAMRKGKREKNGGKIIIIIVIIGDKKYRWRHLGEGPRTKLLFSHCAKKIQA